MNRDNMSRTQLIALVKELEAQNAELRARIGEETLPAATADLKAGDTFLRRARSIGDGVDALFDLGKPQEHQLQHFTFLGGEIVPLAKLPAPDGRLHLSLRWAADEFGVQSEQLEDVNTRLEDIGKRLEDIRKRFIRATAAARGIAF